MTTLDTLSALVHDYRESGGDDQIENTILEILDSEEYRELPYRERNRNFLTSSKLKALKECPYHAKLKYVDEVDMGFESADHFVIGQAVDDFLTLGETKFWERYKIVARRTDKTAEENPGAVLLTNTQGELIGNAVKEYQSRDFFPQKPRKKNIIFLLAGQVAKAELDHFDVENRVIGDIKTCANIAAFEPSFYAMQMAFYAFAIEKKWGEKVEAELYVIDKHSDWSRSHKWRYTRPTLAMHYFEVEKLAQQWKDCVASDIWEHVSPDTEEGREICWRSEFYSCCPFCKSDSPSIV